LRSRVNVRPKVHPVDSGLVGRLLRLTPSKLAGLNPSALSEFGNPGRHTYTHSDRIHVLPIDRLWQPVDLTIPTA
jgi:hypothetical protein